MAPTAGLFELLPKPGETFQGSAVPAAQIVEVGAIVVCLGRQIRQTELLAQLDRSSIHFIGSFELVDVG